ncbi:broad substrate specificity ATP-binding cassette transporter ABCG2 isoform X2 [Ciona intestinalis]
MGGKVNDKEDVQIEIEKASNSLLRHKNERTTRTPGDVFAAATDSQKPSLLKCIPEDLQAKLSFQDVHFVVGESEKDESSKGTRCPCFANTQKYQQVLQAVSGIMKPGLNAIMGPTGSGKSSLLDILAGRKDPSGLSGNILINNRPLPSNFKRISGYVVQQDIVIGTLTVRENLWFSANLRLPRSVSQKDKKKRIEEILYDLGLTMCADTKIGNEMIRGVSGGEKKRASIGMELITAPTVLFLDEPTTGLDASTANAVMFLLKRLGNKGRTIILSIHQPRYSIFRQFDTLTLLSLGRLIYHGPNDKVLPHFDALGYHCEEHNNPADFFLDVINGDSTALSNNIESTDIEEMTDETSKTMAEQLAEKFATSEIYNDTKVELDEIFTKFQGAKKKIAFEGTSQYATPFYYQFAILSQRAAKNVIRNPLASVGNLVLNLIVGVVFGLLYYQVDDTPDTGTQNRFGVLFFITTNLLFGCISAIEVFVKEKDIFVHEYVSGYYRVIAYFLSKLVADLIPMRTIAPIIFCSVTYWMVGLKADPGSFFTFLLMVLLTGYAAVSIALFFSATFNSFAVASIFISLTFVFSILFAGLLVNVDTILPWLAWIKYLSVAQYAFSGLCVNEFRNSLFISCAPRNSTRLPASALQEAGSFGLDISTQGNLTCYSITGEEFLSSRLGIGSVDSAGIVTISDWDQWVNVVALSCITVGMLTLTYIQLMRTKTMT